MVTQDSESESESKDEKKERVLHTRVSENLEEELKRAANELGTSVSNLVRNVLTNTFDIVGSGFPPPPSGGRNPWWFGWVSPADKRKPEPEPEVIGWQELILALNAVCDRCNAILARGTEAAAAVYNVPGPKTFLCKSCLEKVRDTSGK